VCIAASITRSVKGECNSKREKGRKNDEGAEKGRESKERAEEGRKRRERSKGERKERGEGSSRRRMLDVINDKIGPSTKPRGGRIEIKTQFKLDHGCLILNSTDPKM